MIVPNAHENYSRDSYAKEMIPTNAARRWMVDFLSIAPTFALPPGKLSPSIPPAGIYRVPFAKAMQIPADDFFLQIKDKYTRHEKSLWMKFDAAFIKLPKGFE